MQYDTQLLEYLANNELNHAWLKVLQSRINFIISGCGWTGLGRPCLSYKTTTVAHTCVTTDLRYKQNCPVWSTGHLDVTYLLWCWPSDESLETMSWSWAVLRQYFHCLGLILGPTCSVLVSSLESYRTITVLHLLSWSPYATCTCKIK